MKKATTQTEFRLMIEIFLDQCNMGYSERKKWTKSHCISIGKQYKEQVWYCDNVLKNFPTAQIFHNGIDTLFIQYPNGNGKIYLDKMEWAILIPEIESICNKYGNVLFNVNNHLIAA